MANYSDEGYLTRPAGADLSAKQYYIVKQQSDRSVVLSSAATDFHVGVVQLGSASGGNTSFAARNKDGTFKVTLGGTVSVGSYLTSDSSGKAVATTTSGDELIGVAMEAGVSGQTIEFMLLSRKY